MGGIVRLTDPRTGQTFGIDADEIKGINVDPLDAARLNDSITNASRYVTHLFTSQGGMAVAAEDPEDIIDQINALRNPLSDDFDDGLALPPGRGAMDFRQAAGMGEDEGDDETARLGRQIRDAQMPDDVRKEADREFRRLQKLQPNSSEYSVARTWLETLAALPWGKYSETNKDINHAEEILNRDHYGLDKVKQHVLDFVAVMNQPNSESQGTILCFIGPPGVGKTSIATSIADATQRKFQRVALGGVKEEAEVRGHRRTFVGALPGNIVQAMRKAGTQNPVILLDEIDKMGKDSQRGDPAAAMLEVLDPEQNKTFKDHYLDVPLDLSKVMFICTANDESEIPSALHDRMKIVRLPGYTREQKVVIGNRYLVGKQMRKKGLSGDQFELTDGALRSLINDYTSEAGVRDLERKIEDVCAKAVRAVQSDPSTKVVVTAEMLAGLIGSPHKSGDKIPDEDSVGIVNGLAYTSVGGCTLQIEAKLMPGKDFAMESTGNLKDVMRESARVSRSVALSLCEKFGIAAEKTSEKSIHVHVLSGAVPKDGPSAGAALTLAMFSAASGIKVRRDVAMTGEISLNGKVMPIGGLPEKLDGALRDGCKTVLIPKDNVSDLEDVPKEIKDKLEIIPVSTIEQVLEKALVEMPSVALTAANMNLPTAKSVIRKAMTPA